MRLHVAFSEKHVFSVFSATLRGYDEHVRILRPFLIPKWLLGAQNIA